MNNIKANSKIDVKTLAELVKLMDASNLKLLEVCDGDVKIRLEKNTAELANAPVHVIHAPTAKPEPVLKPESKSEVIDFNKLNEVRSPLVGVFYASLSPDSLPFAKIGQKIKKGDVLCIIEAMKQMNEITAEANGEIADICVKNGDIVEYNQVLFKIY